MQPGPKDVSREVLEVVPMVMRTIRDEMRSRRKADLSVPQFRALAFLGRHPGSSLSELAEHLGLTLPSASKGVDGLVARELVVRRESPVDRRRVTLTLTGSGEAMLAAARRGAQARLAELLAALSAPERSGVIEAMRALRTVFAATGDGEGAAAKPKR